MRAGETCIVCLVLKTGLSVGGRLIKAHFQSVLFHGIRFSVFMEDTGFQCGVVFFSCHLSAGTSIHETGIVCLVPNTGFHNGKGIYFISVFYHETRFSVPEEGCRCSVYDADMQCMMHTTYMITCIHTRLHTSVHIGRH